MPKISLNKQLIVFKPLVIISLIICGINPNCYSQQQNELIGLWEGYLLQDSGGLSSSYYLGASIDSISNDSLFGTSLIHIKGDPNTFGTFRMKGFTSGDKVILQDLDILKESVPENTYWCTKTMTNILSKTDSGYVLSGPWTAPNCSKPGSIFLFKPTKEEPMADSLENTVVEVKGAINVSSSEILIEVFDNDREDGDIISLHFNDDWITRYMRVKKKKATIKLTLKEGTNTLIMYAENLGRYPPNTAAIIIHDGDSRSQIILNSDTGKSQAIELRRN